ncbi:MAG: hypothetical protein ACLPSH_04275 [Vulcanimicrobiaceae bacterium]
MTVAETIVHRALKGGHSLKLVGDRIRVIPKPDAELRAAILEHKPEIAALLDTSKSRTCGKGPSAFHRYSFEDKNKRCIDCGRLSKWALTTERLPKPRVCAGLIAEMDEPCRRCGAPWIEHDVSDGWEIVL